MKLVHPLCPLCGASDTRSSTRFRWADLLHRIIGEDAWRCRGCKARFYAHDGAARKVVRTLQHKRGSRRRLSPRERRWITEIAIVVAMAVLFCMFLRYITQERAAAESAVRDYRPGYSELEG